MDHKYSSKGLRHQSKGERQGSPVARQFCKRKYNLSSNHKKKSDAKNRAERVRDAGIMARVVKSAQTGQWLVYSRIK